VESGSAIFRYCEKITKQRLGDFMLKNYKEWMKDVSFFGLESHDLVLVTGTVMTMNWEAATFKASSTSVLPKLPVSLVSSNPTSPKNSFSINWRRWTDNNQGFDSGHRHISTLLSWTQTTTVRRSFDNCCRDSGCSVISAPENFNQCIFLHGWRIREHSRLKLAYTISVEDENLPPWWKMLQDSFKRRLSPSTSQFEPGRAVEPLHLGSSSTLVNPHQESLEGIEAISEEVLDIPV
jgi:hypothetical protein